MIPSQCYHGLIYWDPILIEADIYSSKNTSRKKDI